MKIKVTQEQIDGIALPFLSEIQDKKFQTHMTKGGNLVIIFSRAAGGNSPMLGAYYSSNEFEDGEWIPAKWMRNGKYASISQNFGNAKLDLIMLGNMSLESA